jgi:hypothetical protein
MFSVTEVSFHAVLNTVKFFISELLIQFVIPSLSEFSFITVSDFITVVGIKLRVLPTSLACV